MKSIIITLFGILFIQILGNITAEAQENTEYNLKVSSVPNIIFIGGGGFYNEGSLVTLDAAPESWRDYQFMGWKIDSVWTDKNPPTIRMDKSHTAEAIYEKTNSGGIMIDTLPRITSITVDSTIYLPEELPASFNWPVGSEHTIIIPEVVSSDPQDRFIFDSWKDLNVQTVRTITVTNEDSDYIAIFKTQHYLKIISEHGNTIGGGWNDKGTSVTFHVESDIVYDKRNDNIRYSFDSWSGGDQIKSAINTIDFIQPTTIVANWVPEYRLNVETNVPDFDLYGSGWYIQGKSLALIAETNMETDNADTQYVFEKWVSKGPNPLIIPNAQSPTTTVQLDDAYVIEAHYKPSYKVNVWTPYSTGVGSGFYKEGEMATISLAQTEIVVDPGQIRKIFSNWDTHGARTMNFQQDRDPDVSDSIGTQQNLLVFVDSPVNVTASWKSQYYLNVISDEVKATGEGWYDVGRFAKISISEKGLPPGMWVVQKFDKWTGDVESKDAKERVLMNKPKTVEAEFKEDNTPGIINTLILGGVAVVGVLVYRMTHKTDVFGNGKNNKKVGRNNKSRSFDQFFNINKNTINDEEEDTPLIAPKKNIIETLLSLIKKTGRGNT